MSKTDLNALAERYRDLFVQLTACTKTEDLLERAEGVSVDLGGTDRDLNPKTQDGIVNLNGHGRPDGSIEVLKEGGMSREHSKEVVGRWARRFYPDAQGFACYTCYGSQTAQAINKATGETSGWP